MAEVLSEMQPGENSAVKKNKYGLDVTVENKGVFRFEKGQGSPTVEKEKENQDFNFKPRTNVLHPSLLKKELAVQNEAGVSLPTQSLEKTPSKKVKFTVDTPKASKGRVIKGEGDDFQGRPSLLNVNTNNNPATSSRDLLFSPSSPSVTPNTPQKDLSFFVADQFTSQAMKDLSENFQVDEDSMKCILEGDGIRDDHLARYSAVDFQTPADKTKKNTSTTSAFRRISQAFMGKIDKNKRRSSMGLESAKRLSLSTPKFMKRAKTTKHLSQQEESTANDNLPPIPKANAAEFEAALMELQNIFHDVEREVLKVILQKSNGQVDQAVQLYLSQKIQF